MYCKNCGKQIEDDSKFCKYCGANFTDNSQEMPKLENTEPARETTQPTMPAGMLPDGSNLRFNDFDIKTLIRKHRGDAEADTPYFYGFVQPSGLMLILFGVFAAANYKNYIVNFTKQGLHLYRFGKLPKSLNVKEYSFIPASDIKNVITINGMLQWVVKIQYRQHGETKKMKVQANKKVIGIKEQVPNLERIRQMFNQ